jgi:hypothetical protein
VQPLGGYTCAPAEGVKTPASAKNPIKAGKLAAAITRRPTFNSLAPSTDPLTERGRI